MRGDVAVSGGLAYIADNMSGLLIYRFTGGAKFTSATSSVPENQPIHEILVSITDPATTTTTVNYSVAGGSATGGGVDFTLVPGTLTFAPGETTKTIGLAIHNDSIIEENETIEIEIFAPMNTVLGSPSTHTITIIDNDPEPTPTMTPTASPTQSATPSPSPSVSFTASPTVSPTVTPIAPEDAARLTGRAIIGAPGFAAPDRTGDNLLDIKDVIAALLGQ